LWEWKDYNLSHRKKKPRANEAKEMLDL
jgi:hypothetical protein